MLEVIFLGVVLIVVIGFGFITNLYLKHIADLQILIKSQNIYDFTAAKEMVAENNNLAPSVLIEESKDEDEGWKDVMDVTAEEAFKPK